MAKGGSDNSAGDGKDGKSGKKEAGRGEGSRGIERRLAGMLNSAAGLSGKALKRAANSGLLADTLFKSPERLELMGKAGRALKDMRQTAGLSVEELSSIIDLNDPDILRAVEEGKTGLPVDVMLRLASYYSRNDPLPFIIRFSRTYHPWLSQFLNMTGLDRLMIKAERERKFLKIYRNVDNARKLSDDDFEEVLAFTRRAFNMALHFAEERDRVEPSRRKKGKAAKNHDRAGDKAGRREQDSTPTADAGGAGEVTSETALTEETLDQLDSMVQSEFEASMAEDEVEQPTTTNATVERTGAAAGKRAAAPKKATARRKSTAKGAGAKAKASSSRADSEKE